MKKVLPLFVLMAASSVSARAETIYAAWTELGPHVNWLTRFESETPWLQEEIPLDGPVPMLTLAFNPADGKIYGFDAANCQILCPPFLDPVAIDLVAGTSAFLHLPGLPTSRMNMFDADFDPSGREFRFFGHNGENYRYSLETLEVREDTPLKFLPAYVEAVANRWPLADSAGFETYLIGSFSGLGREPLAGGAEGVLGPSLVRLGGPGGDPPASSGELTWIGNLGVEAERVGFDIAADGTAYVAVFNSFAPPDAENRLLTIDLETGAVQDLGVIVPPSPTSYLTGIVILSESSSGNILEIPALSGHGLAIFVVLLGAMGELFVARRTSKESSR